MTTFTLKLIEFIPENCEIPVYKLLVDDKCLMDEFFINMEKAGNQVKSLEKLQVIILKLAEDTKIPSGWFKELTGKRKKYPYPEYEIKAKRL